MIALLLALGCTTALPPVTLDPPADPDAAVLAAVVEAWNAAQLPAMDLDDVFVTDAPPDVFRSRCRACGPSTYDPNCRITWGRNAQTGEPHVLRANACTVTDDRCEGPFCGLFTDRATLLVVWAGHPQREALIVHEAIHVAGSRSGLGSDAFHRDPRRWCDYSQGGCRPGSVEATARGIR